ncbi:MAG: hypothetical protein CMM01_18625 [Rhodopirellula sp.]|nr:hypothetical protein [Rhodopirellula sp.]
MERMIAVGIRLNESGEVSVDGPAGRALFDLAIALEDAVPLPVDVQHVLAAIVLAERSGLVDDQTRVTVDDPSLQQIIREYLPQVFKQYDDQREGT